MCAIGEPIGPMLKGTTYMVLPAHAAVEQLAQGLLHGDGLDPVVGRPGVVPAAAADEGPVLHPGHVRRVGEGQVAAGPLLRVEPPERPLLDQQVAEPVVLLLRPVAPVDLLGPAELGHLVDPLLQQRSIHPHFGKYAGDHGSSSIEPNPLIQSNGVSTDGKGLEGFAAESSQGRAWTLTRMMEGPARSHRGPGLLLRQAVQRAQAQDQIDAVDADDLAIGEELGQGVQRDRGRPGR